MTCQQDALALARFEGRDSSQVLDHAQELQSRFERFRRLNLPSTWASWGGYCDERVGRMCMRYDEGDWDMEPEPEVIVGARDRLLDDLAAAGEALPGDAWVLGQRLRYMAEAGRWKEAVALASACSVEEPGWCDALKGFALHGAGRYVDAEEAFERGLERMDPAEAGRWRDPSVLLEDRGDVLRNAADPARADALVARAWLLADPLFLKEGNDRLTEHYARYVMGRLRADSRSTYGMTWGRDLEELLVRYGWEVGWERTHPSPGEARSTSVVGHHHPDALTYVPPPSFVSMPADLDPAHWDLDPDHPRSSYAPAYSPQMSRADVQVARFWRGDSVVVVAAYRMVPPPRDPHAPLRRETWTEPLPDETAIQAGLYLVPDVAGTILGRTVRSGPTGALSVRAPAGSYVVSVEAWSRERRVASRSRSGLRADPVPWDVPALSDALVVDPVGGLPATLRGAIREAWPGTAVPSDARVALAWEMSGIGPGPETLQYRITLEKRDRGFVEKAVSIFGLGGKGPVLTLAWSETTPDGTRRQFRAADLDLPAVDTGRYRIVLEATLSGRSTMRAVREIEVTEAPSASSPDAR